MKRMKKMTKRNCVRASGTSMAGIVAGLILLVASFDPTVEAKYTGRQDFLPKGPPHDGLETEARMLIAKAAKVGGGQGSSSGSSGSSGNNMLSAAYVDGEYYGCLALSEEQQAELRKSGRSCDYTIHIYHESSRTGKSKNKNSSSGNSAAASDSTGVDSDGSTSATAEAGNEAGEGDGYTISYYYEDNADSTGASDGSDQADSGTASEQTATSQGSNSGNNGKNQGSSWYSWKKNTNGQATNQNSESSSGGNSGVAQNSDGNQVVSVIDSDYETPYNAFDIEFCDTYENLWTWDLEISCGNTSDYRDCHCTFAEVLMENGQLTCDAYKNCPRGCSICSNCLKLLGCDNTFAGRISHNTSTVATAIAVLSILLAGCCLLARNKRRKRGKLDDQLMDDGGSDARGTVWMVPMMGGVPHESGKSKHPVWLVPDSESVSTGTSSASLSTESSHDRSVNREIIDLTDVTSLDDKQRYIIRSFPRNLFPDVLAPPVLAKLGLPSRGIPTAPTDISGQSDASLSDEEIDAVRRKNYTPRRHRQTRRQEKTIAESVDEESENTHSYTTGSSSSSYYSSHRERLDLPSLTGAPRSRVPGDPPMHYEPPGNRTSFSSHVNLTA